jgi:hypothetical protein
VGAPTDSNHVDKRATNDYIWVMSACGFCLVVKSDEVEWNAAEYVKPWDMGGGLVFLQRNCPCCHSTLVKEMPPQSSDH